MSFAGRTALAGQSKRPLADARGLRAGGCGPCGIRGLLAASPPADNDPAARHGSILAHEQRAGETRVSPSERMAGRNLATRQQTVQSQNYVIIEMTLASRSCAPSRRGRDG